MHTDNTHTHTHKHTHTHTRAHTHTHTHTLLIDFFSQNSRREKKTILMMFIACKYWLNVFSNML